MQDAVLTQSQVMHQFTAEMHMTILFTGNGVTITSLHSNALSQ